MNSMPDVDESCFVCRKHRGDEVVPGGAIYEDEIIYLGHAQMREGERTAYLGYLMLEPKRHVPGLGHLTDEEAEALGRFAARISRVLMAAEAAEHVYAFVIGDAVPHLHIHLVPRYPGAPRDYWGPRVDEWPEAPRGGPGEIEALCHRLRAALEAA